MIWLARRTGWDATALWVNLSKNKDQGERTLIVGKLVDRPERRQGSGSRDEQGEDERLHCGDLDGQKRRKVYLSCEVKERVLFNS
jgi:hypothetical protein